MGISDIIAGFIGDLLVCGGGCAELQRAELAQRFGCVPSQINYVISTRFSPEHGYLVESRRGGGGYIRIRRVQADGRQLLVDTIRATGGQLDAATARAYLSNLMDAGAMDGRTARLVAAATGDGALRCLPVGLRDRARAGIFKQMLVDSICPDMV